MKTYQSISEKGFIADNLFSLVLLAGCFGFLWLMALVTQAG